LGFIRSSWNVDVNIDPVEQRAEDLGHVSLDLHSRALALASQIVEEATRAWVHCHFAMSP
jgi:hypothetical protein